MKWPSFWVGEQLNQLAFFQNSGRREGVGVISLCVLSILYLYSPCVGYYLYGQGSESW